MNICVVDLDDTAFAGVDVRKGRDLETLLAHAPDCVLDKAGDLYDWLAYAVANRIQLGDPALDWTRPEKQEGEPENTGEPKNTDDDPMTILLDACRAIYDTLAGEDDGQWEDVNVKDRIGLLVAMAAPCATPEQLMRLPVLYDRYIGMEV